MTRRASSAWCLAIVLAAMAPLALGAHQTAAPDVDVVLAHVGAYLKTYERQFSAVVAEESYRQSVTFATDLDGFGRNKHVDLHSDVMVLNAGGSHWVQIRDVYEVDKKSVRDHQARLLALLQSPNHSAFGGEAETIANESARYNLGVNRNINVPTMALTYLTAENQPRSRFTLGGTDILSGVKAVVVKFEETASPSLVHDPNGNVATFGRDWVDPASGAVLRTELTCITPSRAPITATVTVDYGRVPNVSMLVPMSMDEKYRIGEEIDTGKAVYSNFRAFAVDTSAFFRSGGGRQGK